MTGTTAFLVELTCHVGGAQMTYTTEVSVVQVPEPITLLLLIGFALVPVLKGRRLLIAQTD